MPEKHFPFDRRFIFPVCVDDTYEGRHTGVFSDTGADLNDVMHFGEEL